MTQKVLGLGLLYAILVGGFALWQRAEVAAAHQKAAVEHPADPVDPYNRALHRTEIGALVSLALVGGLGLAVYVLLVRRSREVADLLESALAGRQVQEPRVKDEFAIAFAAAARVGQELHLERERGAQARQRLNTVSLLMDVGVLLVDSAHRLDFANHRACELLDCASFAELERRWAEIGPLFGSAVGSGEQGSSRLDLEVPGAAGPRSLRCLVYTLAEENVQVFLFLVRDRVLLDALETDLLLASQLRCLSRVYGAITHDLKAPLHAMVMNLDLLQSALRRGEGAREAEASEQYLDVLREEIGRLDRSLLALLAETTPAGRDREEFDARAMVEEVESLLRPQARLQQVTLAAHLPESAVRIAGQRDRLKQAVLNVAINALEAMSEGGALELRLEAVANEVEVLVTDSGPGIPEAVRPRIFDMHFTTKTSGTGIGLYVARSIVEAHGGEISVLSAPERGSEFRLRLPALETEE